MVAIGITLIVIFIVLCLIIRIFHDGIKPRPVLKAVVTWGALASLFGGIINLVISFIVG